MPQSCGEKVRHCTEECCCRQFKKKNNSWWCRLRSFDPSQNFKTPDLLHKSDTKQLKCSTDEKGNGTLNHSFSTDANPTHTLCPHGPKSWCFYNKALALHRIPKTHKTRIHTQLDKKLLWPHLKPIYKRLTDTKLLESCLMKGTQNSNESFHHTVWEKLPKTQLYSLQRCEFGLLSAVGEFNFGP